MSRGPHMVGGAGLALLLALAACSGDVIDVSVALTVDENACGGPDPGSNWLPCGGRVGVWLLSGDGDVLDEQCVPFDAEPLAISDLLDLLAPISFGGLGEGDRIAIEIAVYSTDVGETCPRFDPDGAIDGFPAYFGRSDIVSLSSSAAELAVDLACYAPVVEPCIDAQLQVSATVTDMETWEPLLPEQPVLSVSAGVVTQSGEYMNGGELEAQGPEWAGTIFATLNPDECVGVAVTTDVAEQPFLSCDSDVVEQQSVLAQGYALDPQVLENIIGALGPENPIDTGLALGRLVNMENIPVGGALITPIDPGLTVEYLSADMQTLDGDSTADHGYFVMRSDTPGCCFDILQVEPLGEAEMHPFGIVPGMLTLVPVRVQP